MIRVKNWKHFQHFKDRNPPWIKVYKEILERRDINLISDCNFRILIGLWLLASEDETRQGVLPEIPDIAFRLRKSEKEITEAFRHLSHFFIFDDTDRYHDDINAISLTRSRETETETEEETEKKEITNVISKKDSRACRLGKFMEAEGLDDIPQEWGDWSYETLRLTPEEINFEWNKFCDYWKAQGGQKGAKLDWFATWRNWCRKKFEEKQRKEELNGLYSQKRS